MPASIGAHLRAERGHGAESGACLAEPGEAGGVSS